VHDVDFVGYCGMRYIGLIVRRIEYQFRSAEEDSADKQPPTGQ
jgi:hypothetical protein